MMKTQTSLLNPFAIAVAVATLTFPLGGVLSATGQTVRTETRTSSTAPAGTRLEVRTVDGQTEVHLNGQPVYNGPADGPVTTRSRSVNGVKHTAIYAGETLLWDSATATAVPGQPTPPAPPAPPTPPGPSSPGTEPGPRKSSDDVLKETDEVRRDARSGAGRRGKVEIRKIDGSTVIVYQGREISVGPTEGPIKAKVIQEQGEDYAAAFEGERVIWESRPGAARHLR